MAEKVIVGCKLPHGIYLDLHDSGNNLTAREKLPGIASFTLPNSDRKFKNPDLTNGATLTPIDKDHWLAWLKIHHDHPAVKNGAIFVANKPEEAARAATERNGQDFGFEKLKMDANGVTKLNDLSRPVNV